MPTLFAGNEQELSIFCFRFHDSVVSPTADDFENGHGAWVRGQINSTRWGTVIMYDTYPISTAMPLVARNNGAVRDAAVGMG